MTGRSALEKELPGKLLVSNAILIQGRSGVPAFPDSLQNELRTTSGIGHYQLVGDDVGRLWARNPSKVNAAKAYRRAPGCLVMSLSAAPS